MSQVTKQLYAVLANSAALALKLQNYHWNVEGRHFKQLHELFGEQYEEVSEAIDAIAERIRALGEKVPASFTQYQKANKMTDAVETLDENAMAKDACESHVKLVAVLKKALEAAQKDGDEVSADMMIGRMAAHDKAAWMLRSSLPDAMRGAKGKDKGKLKLA